MSLKKKIVTVLAAAAWLLGITVGMAAPAAANHVGCPINRICFWDYLNYSGSVISITLPQPGNCVTLPSNWKNRAESYRINSTKDLAMYDYDGCRGFWGNLYGPSEEPDLLNMWNNINSFYVIDNY